MAKNAVKGGWTNQLARFIVDRMEVGVHEAKTTLSKLLQRVAAGEDVVITRDGTPVARLVAVRPAARVMGQDRGRYVVPDDFDAPLSDEELRAFEGGGE